MTLAVAPTARVSAGESMVECTDKAPTIVGTGGNDTLTGTPGNDVIAGLGGNDVINSGGGNDRICPGDGNDTVSAGGGNDLVDASGSSGSDLIQLGSGADLELDGVGSSHHLAGTGPDFVVDLDGNDTYHLGQGDDTWDGGGGRNFVYGGTGNDFLRPWHNVAIVRGIVDHMTGDSGNDLVDYSATSANTGRIRVYLGPGRAVTRDGGASIFSSVESAEGGPYRDVLYGDGERNDLFGFDGRDLLLGRGGDDHLDPTGGSVICSRWSPHERLRGGPGSGDWASFGCPPGARANLSTGRASAINETACRGAPFRTHSRGSAHLNGIENLSGSPASCPDVLIGNEKANVLVGKGSADFLDGRVGADDLAGDQGTDRLIGGYGIDRLSGGAGSDFCKSGEREVGCEQRQHPTRQYSSMQDHSDGTVDGPWTIQRLQEIPEQPSWVSASIRL